MEHHPIVQTLKTLIKPINYILGFAVACVGIFDLLKFPGLGVSFYFLVYPSYMIFFGIIMLASDFKLQVIIDNCKFMDMCLGRGLFYLYVGSLQWYMRGINNVSSGSIVQLLSIIAAIVFWVLGGFLIILHFISSEKKLSNSSSEETKETTTA